jgi:hypothetical protein
MPKHWRKGEVCPASIGSGLFAARLHVVPLLTTESGGPRNSTLHGFPNAFKSSRLGFVKKTSLKPIKNACTSIPGSISTI